MDNPWRIHVLSMDYPRIIHGLSMGNTFIIHGLSIDNHGLSMDLPWIIYRLAGGSVQGFIFLFVELPWQWPFFLIATFLNQQFRRKVASFGWKPGILEAHFGDNSDYPGSETVKKSPNQESVGFRLSPITEFGKTTRNRSVYHPWSLVILGLLLSHLPNTFIQKKTISRGLTNLVIAYRLHIPHLTLLQSPISVATAVVVVAALVVVTRRRAEALV